MYLDHRAQGLDVVVCAPGHILKSATDRIKVDKRDAIRLARLLSAGELREARVPEPEQEQLRDLVRSRVVARPLTQAHPYQQRGRKTMPIFLCGFG
jgi:transposase